VDLKVRRTWTFVEERRIEAGQKADVPLRKVAVVTVLENPLAGRYVPDLRLMIEASVGLGAEMARPALAAMAPFEVQSYGKGGIVGTAGEQEHANALLTTAFATPFRDAIGRGDAWVSSMTKVAAPGTLIDIPMNCIDDVYVRSHYDGMSLVLPDTPMPDEIAIVFCLANRARINARVGGMTFAEARQKKR
jgi:hypothetical protein